MTTNDDAVTAIRRSTRPVRGRRSAPYRVLRDVGGEDEERARDEFQARCSTRSAVQGCCVRSRARQTITVADSDYDARVKSEAEQRGYPASCAPMIAIRLHRRL